MDKVIVSTDVRKLTSISLSYLIIAAILVAMALLLGAHVILRVLCFALAALMFVGIAYNVRQIIHRRVLFMADERGVTDYSKAEDVLFMPWERIVRVELKASNSNALMLDVVGYKTVDEVRGLTAEQRTSLEDAGGKAYFLLELSGLWVTRSKLKEAFAGVCRLGAHHNPDIVFRDFKDPLAVSAHQSRGHRGSHENCRPEGPRDSHPKIKK